MAQPDYSHMGGRGMVDSRTMQNQPTNVASLMASEEDLADVDEPPDLQRTPRPSTFKTPFTKASPPPTERKASLLTSALHSDTNASADEEHDSTSLRRGMSCVSNWSNNSATTAELTSDGGFTSTRTSTPSPPLPQSAFRTMVPIFNKKPFDQPVSVIRHDDDNIGPLQKVQPVVSGENGVEATLGRKRCISFACGRKNPPLPSPEPVKPKTVPEPVAEVPKRACTISFACGPRTQPKPTSEPAKPMPMPNPAAEAPKRVCTISFACPSKVSTDAPSKINKPRIGRAVSPAPLAHRQRGSSKVSVKHRDSDSTVRTMSPVSVRKTPAMKDRCRRLSGNSDLGRTEAYRFHEFASSEEEIEDWTLESTCHRSRLTISDTLRVENNLRQLAEEAEEEAMDEDDEDDLDEDADDADSDDDDLENDDEDEEEDEEDEMSDAGFQTDDENGFAGSDDESDAGSDFNWWAPGAAYSTAATSMEHLEQLRPSARRSISESSIGSVESEAGFKMPVKPMRRKRSRPVNIRVPSPELPDSTDFVCGTLDEDRPLEAAYMSCLERRRAAKHKITPQDIDPTFPTSDPEMDEEDEDDEQDVEASESDQHFMMHGQMEHLDGDHRGRGKALPMKRSPAPSPRRMRSPAPIKRAVHRSPPPRKLFGNSPRRARSPAPGVRLRSPPPTRRGSEIMSPQRGAFNVRFGGLAERPALIFSSSVPRTPLTALPMEDMDGEDTCREFPARGAINIKVGLEKKRQRRREQLYKKTHRKGTKEKRPAPGKGCERMREMGIGLAAYRGKTTGFGFGFGLATTPDQKDMLVLSV